MQGRWREGTLLDILCFDQSAARCWLTFVRRVSSTFQSQLCDGAPLFCLIFLFVRIDSTSMHPRIPHGSVPFIVAQKTRADRVFVLILHMLASLVKCRAFCARHALSGTKIYVFVDGFEVEKAVCVIQCFVQLWCQVLGLEQKK